MLLCTEQDMYCVLVIRFSVMQWHQLSFVRLDSILFCTIKCASLSLFQFENGTQTLSEETVAESSLSPEEMEMIETRMQERKERLLRKCHEFGLDVRRNDSLHRPNPWEFLVNRRYHLIWCNVFKAASTSWMYNFNVLAGYSPAFLRKTNTVPLELARKRYERVSISQVTLF